MAIVKVINKSKNNLPQYETIGSAGMDVRADIAENMELAPMQRALVPTGLFVEIPQGYEMQVRPRSGLAIKKGITLVNSPGTIDSDYRGEIKVIVINLSTEISAGFMSLTGSPKASNFSTLPSVSKTAILDNTSSLPTTMIFLPPVKYF